MTEPRFALDLLTEAAKHQECDELFRRIEWPSQAAWLAMIKHLRDERAAWGDMTDEEGVGDEIDRAS